jgi:hypothetical protein
MALDACGSIGRQYRAFQTRRLFQRAAGICAAFLIATPLHALSCAPYGLPEILQEVVKSEHGYVAVTGTLTFDTNKLPKPTRDNTAGPDLTKIKGNITGKSLSRAGFKNTFSTDLTLEVRCLGPWCARAKSNAEVLVFLKQTQNGYTLAVQPCGSHIVYRPTRSDLNSTKQCYLTNNCPKQSNY